MCVAPCVALAQEIPAALRAAILLRALQYEKGFASGTGAASLAVIAHGTGSSDGTGMATVLTQLAAKASGGRRIYVSKVEREITADELRKMAPHVVYVATGSENSLAAARSLSSVVVLCGSPWAVGKGCTLSVEKYGDTSRLVVDLAEAQRKGLRFDARMLRIARIVR